MERFEINMPAPQRNEFVNSLLASQAKKGTDNASSSGLFMPKDVELFRKKLSAMLLPNLPAKELICLITKCALEVEFGESFTLNKGFDKIVEKIADSVMRIPELRRQSLSIVSTIIEGKMDQRKN